MAANGRTATTRSVARPTPLPRTPPTRVGVSWFLVILTLPPSLRRHKSWHGHRPSVRRPRGRRAARAERFANPIGSRLQANRPVRRRAVASLINGRQFGRLVEASVNDWLEQLLASDAEDPGCDATLAVLGRHCRGADPRRRSGHPFRRGCRPPTFVRRLSRRLRGSPCRRRWLVGRHRTQRRKRGLRSDPMPFDTPKDSCLPGGPHGKLVAREPKTAR
jgi:hypothetical protein